MSTKALYKTEPLKSWGRAKEIRENFYRDYAQAHEKGGLRWAGGAWTFGAIPCGLGEDVWSITSEPYAASIAANKEFSQRCLEANSFFSFLCSGTPNPVSSAAARPSRSEPRKAAWAMASHTRSTCCWVAVPQTR